MSAARRYEARTFHLTVDDVNEFSKSSPRRNFEFHDINSYVECWRSQVARSERHGDDAFIMSNIESQWRIYSRSCLGQKNQYKMKVIYLAKTYTVWLPRISGCKSHVIFIHSTLLE